MTATTTIRRRLARARALLAVTAAPAARPQCACMCSTTPSTRTPHQTTRAAIRWRSRPQTLTRTSSARRATAT
eukprot:3248192-Prymnesium_polylepis.1